MEPRRPAICEAIGRRRSLRVSYKGASRLVEPHCYGYLHARRHELLRCFQVEGPSASGNPVGWKLLIVSSIRGIEESGEEFEPRADFQPDDQGMDVIFCRV